MSRILQQAHAFIGDVEKDHRCPQDRSGSNHLHIDDVCDPDQQEDQYFAEDPLKTDCAG